MSEDNYYPATDTVDDYNSVNFEAYLPEEQNCTVVDDYNSVNFEAYLPEEQNCTVVDDYNSVNFEAYLPEEQNCTVVLSKADLQQGMEDDITKLSAIVPLSRDSALLLLRHCNWSVNEASEAWFADEDSVRKALGLFKTPEQLLHHDDESSDSGDFDCGICLASYPREKLFSASCGHLFCEECWESYLSACIEDQGSGALGRKCPDSSCSAAVDRGMVNKLALPEVKDKYETYLLHAYMAENRKVKWCPAPECDYAIQHSGEEYEVSCLCSNRFCWNCSEESHRPVDCDTVTKWILKNSSEGKSGKWILDFTKPCPKCKTPMEKNSGGRIQMICKSPCNFHFCWLCLGSWSQNHDKSKFSCKIYEGRKKKLDERRARNPLEKYTHYYERWASNDFARKKALSDLQSCLENIRVLGKIKCMFMVEAWEQIVECRRVLKWSYAYGYYFPEHQSVKKSLFEYFQGEAEVYLEKLHRCAEKGMVKFMVDEDEDDVGKFSDLRVKLTELTSITKKYFENLVKSLENNGLSDDEVDSSSSSKNVDDLDDNPIILWSALDQLGWSCDRCTFYNNGTATTCQMCEDDNSDGHGDLLIDFSDF